MASGQPGPRVERFVPGRNDQILLLNDRARYGNFEIRNLAANGEIWTWKARAHGSISPI